MNEHDPGTTPVPDPTILTTEALERGLKAEREYVDGEGRVLAERLDGIDRATTLRAEAVAKDLAHLSELMDKGFEGIALQFKERDERSRRESQDNTTAVNAAFAAAKEAVAEQTKASTKAIDKSEAGTAETIKQNDLASKARLDALGEKVDDLKTRVNGREGNVRGTNEQREESRANVNVWVGVVGAVIAMALLLLAYQASRSHTTVVPDQAPAVTVTTPR